MTMKNIKIQLLFLVFCVLIQFAECQNNPITTRIKLTTFRYDYEDEKVVLIALMKTGVRPPTYAYVTREYNVAGIECNRTDDTFKFAIAKPSNYHFTCPKHDGFHNPKINKSHSLMCPTYCQVCKNVFICSGEPSFSGIRYMEDGRKKDQISFHYGTMIRFVDLEINWFILACYIFLFTLFTNIIAFVFTD
ncbi:hypothetical protein L5515_012230 [Caenorhabditis briggsae]|uniref:Uncharacterized protein n=1 Tax=Caenorhabditis briggsae TaxID=6238 RepID=A0AAE9ES17_CAEBR|nr:hypothetical protein L5515_012230 [Caenorhabditis briggsae]